MKKRIFIGILIIIGLFLITGCGNKVKEVDKEKQSQKIEYKSGDTLTAEELKKDFEKIYTNHTNLSLGIVSEFNDAEYPYITAATLMSDDEMMIIYFTGNGEKNISYQSVYTIATGELKSVQISLDGVNNETEFKTGVALASSSVVIGEDIDMSISNGINGALMDQSEEAKVVKNKYGDPVWIIQKTHSLNGQVKSTRINLTKSGLEHLK